LTVSRLRDIIYIKRMAVHLLCEELQNGESKMKKGISERYFTKKKLSVLEIILIVIAAISFLVAAFVWGGGPFGTAVFAISALAFFFCRSAKPKDSDIDELIKAILDKAGIVIDDNTLTLFDMKSPFVLKGKDGQIRTGKMFVVKISSSPRSVISYTIDLLCESIETQRYELDETEKVCLREEEMYVLGSRKRINYISSDSFIEDIPVPLDDVNAMKIVHSLCNAG